MLWLAFLAGASAQDDTTPSPPRFEEDLREEEGPRRPIALSASVQATYGTSDSAGSGGAGHDVRVGLPLQRAPRLVLEGISASTGRSDFELRGGLRGYLDVPWTEQGALSLSTSLGTELALGSNNIGMWTVGAAYDSPIRGRLITRVGLEAVISAETGLRASVGLTLPPRKSSVLIRQVTIYQPLPPEAPEELTAIADAVWVPEPVCDWMPPDEAASLLAQILRGEVAVPDTEPDTSGTGTTTTVIEAGEAQSPEAVGAALAAQAATPGRLPFWAPDATEGTLIVLAHPGDQVTLDGRTVAVDDTGIARMQREEGPVRISVSSGGQLQELRAALVVNHTVWVRAHDPEPSAVFFNYNDTRLDRAALAMVGKVAQNAAGWSFVLQGGYSPEGTLEHNRKLAIDRARVVSRALQAAGVPADRIVFLEPPPPDPNRPAEEQRNCRIIPVAPDPVDVQEAGG